MKLRVEAEIEEADKVCEMFYEGSNFFFWSNNFLQITADEDRKNLLSQMADVLSKLSFGENSGEFEFLPTSWLRSFVSRPSAVKEVSTATFLCKHKNIDSEKVLMLKVSERKPLFSFKLIRIGNLLDTTFVLGSKFCGLWENFRILPFCTTKD